MVIEAGADKGYHSNDVVLGLAEMEVRTYIAEPDRGARNWKGKAAENGSRGTSRISLTQADWTGCTYEARKTCTRSF
jgi:hypothetical protein